MRWWRTSVALSENLLPHLGHLKGFLPQGVCRCHVSVELLPKFMPHTPHECTSGARGCHGAELPGAVGQVLGAWFHSPTLLQKARGQCAQQSELVVVPLKCARAGGSAVHCSGTCARHRQGHSGKCERQQCSSRAQRCRTRRRQERQGHWCRLRRLLWRKLWPHSLQI